MTESTQDNTSEQMQLSNRESFDKWNIDPFVDPMNLELETLDPAHPALFEANTFWPYFERLRAESPVHYTPESMVGPLLVGCEVHRHHARRHASRGVFLRH